MPRGYLVEFILGQKCIPWFIIVKWRATLKKFKALVNFISVQRFIEIIDLEKTYASSFDESFTLEDIIESKNCRYPGKLLRDSVYVQFLDQFKNKADVSNEDIKGSKYYRAFWKRIRTYGSFNGIKDKEALLQYCRSFLELYRATRKRLGGFNLLKLISDSINYSQDSYPWVFKIMNSDYCMVYDGLHRLSCEYVLGNKFVKVRIVGVRKNSFQALEYEEDVQNLD
jgi:hypothetical protein